MSEQRPKRSPAEAWEAIQKRRLREEGERVAKMSRAELDASLAARGVDAGAARARGAALAAKLLAQRATANATATATATASESASEPAPASASASESASASAPASEPASEPAPAPASEPVSARAADNVVSFTAERAKRRPAWLLPLVAAAALVVLGGGGGAIVALSGPAPSATPVPTAPPGPSPEELAQRQRARAEELRKLAAAECAGEKWGPCRADLDDATKLDPEGDRARAVQRLQVKAARGIAQLDVEAKLAPLSRSLAPEDQARFAANLAGSKGQAIGVVCARGVEPAALCEQVVAALKRAGWSVTRTNAVADAGLAHGLLVEVAPDADDATQAAADALVAALERAGLFARGPNDAAPGGDAALRLTVGPP